ncbi:MAG: hypothetical protein AB1602_04850 [Elusimicrobiota bacterium]
MDDEEYSYGLGFDVYINQTRNIIGTSWGVGWVENLSSDFFDLSEEERKRKKE